MIVTNVTKKSLLRMTNLNSSILDVKTITNWKPDRLKARFCFGKGAKEALQPPRSVFLFRKYTDTERNKRGCKAAISVTVCL